jgi:prevent-host-death family protein
MTRLVSVRELRNHTASVVAALRDGESIALTVNGLPVADIVPYREERSPWVPVSVLRRIVEETPADPGLLTDIADVRGALIDE